MRYWLALLWVVVCSCGGDDNGPSAPAATISGTWAATITSPSAPACNGSFNVVFTQIGNDFTGNFSIPGNASGTFTGSINGNQMSGTFTSMSGGCIGTGAFTGTRSTNLITISAPVVASANPFCQFCQSNVITARR